MKIVKRHYWSRCIEELWQKKSLVWLSGARRSGKTCLCKGLDNILYLDCELPSVRRELADCEAFLTRHQGKRIVLDEIHRLPNPAELLKIAADHFADTRIVATGSSTLGASAKFRDTLAGRKLELWLPPMIAHDCSEFKNSDLEHRLRHGGLPPFFLAPAFPEAEFHEWIDAFWAKDILELFRLERRHSFQRFFEMLGLQSGGIFEATHFAAPCEVSRPTIASYLAVLEATRVVHVVRPFHARGAQEIIAAPKVYLFDSGFVCYFHGWDTLRREDLGMLWEHYVLNELAGRLQQQEINYWRDKRHHEIDFVIARHGKASIAIECKWSADSFSPAGLKAFRSHYPLGDNFVVASDVERPFTRDFNGFTVKFVGIGGLATSLEQKT